MECSSISLILLKTRNQANSSAKVWGCLSFATLSLECSRTHTHTHTHTQKYYSMPDITALKANVCMLWEVSWKSRFPDSQITVIVIIGMKSPRVYFMVIIYYPENPGFHIRWLFLGSSRLSLQKPHFRSKIAQSLSIDRFEETGGMLASLNAQPTERKRSISWTLPATSFFQLRVLCNYLKTAWTLCSGVTLFRLFSAKLQTRTAKTSETFIR